MYLTQKEKHDQLSYTLPRMHCRYAIGYSDASDSLIGGKLSALLL